MGRKRIYENDCERVKAFYRRKREQRAVVDREVSRALALECAKIVARRVEDLKHLIGHLDMIIATMNDGEWLRNEIIMNVHAEVGGWERYEIERRIRAEIEHGAGQGAGS